MAILSYVTVASATTPMSPDSPSQPQMPTKILLPKKKPLKWSTGVAPGEYGGPPTTSKLRKYWGGDKGDPLESNEYMWNKDFVGRFKKMIDDSASGDSLKTPVKEKPSGFLSLNRVMTLESLDVDLSKELTKPTVSTLQEAIASPAEKKARASPKWRPAPTRREQEKWDRATKAATGGSEVILRESRKPQGDPNILAAESREQYFKLKKKLQILTFGVGGIGLVSAYVSYSPEIAASFGAGFLGSLIYIRMLGSSVDSLADGAKGLIKGAIGQPRLLVPVVLVMFYNRWNGILVPEYGAMHLELVPMLIGFFTYKIATFVQAIEEALSGITRKTQP
ncbi:hypothetical protein MLD38_030575 [Melastoma candidum]|uniref:Uncharacterized protein n=1 Tax=Melastoma candidum TaxID=119954 RepID=A0ACB9MM70_9MYRT|nr:hypothetical protein MLD38_030575 [Melastoma candidum]